MRVILLGPPGSGKGTQADLIQQSYGFPKISTGDLLRKEVELGTDLGKKVGQEMKAGRLVSDELVLELVEKRIGSDDCRQGYVLDGFPRTLNQARLLEKVEANRPETAFEFKINEQEILRRLSGRMVCLQCGAVYNIDNNRPQADGLCDLCGSKLVVREDDRPEVIRERIRLYLETIAPLIDYYSSKNVLFEINAEDTAENIFRAIQAVLDRRLTVAKEH
ncbi:MAG TPA: adenylate kinase [Candidatus Saccharicenans sp.]|jgi:adenylate kinase|nr:adenylate kinase [Candidatus Saccharicenans sp.]HOL46283.1 adenylate kinase [Candidatus Saccharicenans sp.]HPP24073.1 adenylate kinase [Candidatus Saccharicenans sp.]